MLLCYEISPLLLELPPCGQVQVIVLSVQLLREWPCLTVSSRSLWYVTGWGCILCMLHSFTWIFMLFCLNEINSFETFYGACVPNVLWFISIFPLQCFEVIWLNYYLTVFRIMIYVISRCLMCTLINVLRYFYVGKTGCYSKQMSYGKRWCIRGNFFKLLLFL